jgi:hypothetical protein
MTKTKYIQSFNTKPLLDKVEKVIQDGLNDVLSNFMDRYELLEKTHRQIMRLPSVLKEIDYRDNDSDYDDRSESSDNFDLKGDDKTMFVSIKDMTQELVSEEMVGFEKRLDKLEKNYESMIPILDRILSKMTNFNEEIREIRLSKTEKNITSENFEKSSVVKTCENENVKIHIIEEDNEDKTTGIIQETIKSDIMRDTDKDSDESTEEQEVEEVVDEEAVEESVDEAVVEELDEVVEEEVELDEVVEEEVELDEVVEEEEVVVEEEEKEEVVEEEVVEEEVVEEEVVEEEEEEVVEEESVEEEVVEEEVVEEEVVEEEVVEEESVEEEEEVEEEELSIETETKEETEDDDEEIFEIEIDDKTYCTNDDKNGFIWELTEDGEQGDKIGYFKDEEPFFYADEN